MTARVTVSFGKFWNVRIAQAVTYPLKSIDFSKTNSEVLMRHFYLGFLAFCCCGLTWSAGDEMSVKGKVPPVQAAKAGHVISKASPKLTAAELANLATQHEIAQRRAALAASVAVVPAAPPVNETPATDPSLAVIVPPLPPVSVPPTPPSASATLQALPVAPTPGTSDVHVGRMVCELGNAVSITPDAGQPGSYWVQMRQHRFHMMPVATTTGAVRLEDAHAGAMWLQLPHKSMLMNSKLGQRMADECQSAHQVDVAARMKSGPASNLLDGPNFAKK